MSLHLNCLYPAEKPRIFQVEIDPDLMVYNLVKDVLHKVRSFKGKPNIYHQDIRLFKVDLPTEPEEDLSSRALRWLHDQKEDDGLCEIDQLLSIFPAEPSPSGMVHVIVSDTLFFQHKKLRKDLDKRIDSLRPTSSPSEIIGSKDRIRELLEGVDARIYLGRPSGAPAAIFSPALATLQHRLEHLDQVQVTPRDVEHAADYLNQAVEFYHDETGRKEALKGPIDVAVQGGDWNTRLNWADGIKPDCCWWHKSFLTMVLAIKNVVGLNGNPVLEAIVAYGKIISQEKYTRFREFCNFPAVLIGIAENCIDISIAVCVGDVHITKLLTLDATSGFLASDNIVHLARVFVALSSCQKNLTLYYDGVEQRKAPKLSCLFPKPTPVDPSNVVPCLTYKEFLSREGQPASVVESLGNFTTTARYVATLDESDKEVIVKFTARYNEKAHRILANAGFAPKLHFCGRVVGGLYMVVMDRVDGRSLWHRQIIGIRIPILPIVLEHVRQALDLLHEQNIVFGDLRESNIIYNANKQCTVVVDFDWPGEDGVSRYPATLNPANPWPDDVVRYGIMFKAHDLWQLKRLSDLAQHSA